MTGRIATCEGCEEEWTLVDSSDPKPACPSCGVVFDNFSPYEEAAERLVRRITELILSELRFGMLDFETLKAEVLRRLYSA